MIFIQNSTKIQRICIENLVDKFYFLNLAGASSQTIVRASSIFSQTPPGRVVQSPINLTQDKQEFGFEFCNFATRVSFYIVWPSYLSFNNIKPRKTA